MHLLDGGNGMFSAIDRKSSSAEFLRENLRKLIRVHTSNENEVRSILVVSAHWECKDFTIDYQLGDTKLIYDYYGFPPESYAPYMTYPVKTDLALADRVSEILQSQGIKCRKENRGFDHGTFIPLKVAFPNADIPVVQLSLKSNLNIEEHVRMGEALRPLRDEGVLIIASGQITHNLRALGASRDGIDSRASSFTEYMKDFLESVNRDRDYTTSKALFNDIENSAPYFEYNHPRSEHFTPMAVAFGAAFAEDDKTCPTEPTKAQRIYAEIVLGSMGIDSYIFSQHL